MANLLEKQRRNAFRRSSGDTNKFQLSATLALLYNTSMRLVTCFQFKAKVTFGVRPRHFHPPQKKTPESCKGPVHLLRKKTKPITTMSLKTTLEAIESLTAHLSVPPRKTALFSTSPRYPPLSQPGKPPLRANPPGRDCCCCCGCWSWTKPERRTMTWPPSMSSSLLLLPPPLSHPLQYRAAHAGSLLF